MPLPIVAANSDAHLTSTSKELTRTCRPLLLLLRSQDGIQTWPVVIWLKRSATGAYFLHKTRLLKRRLNCVRTHLETAYLGLGFLKGEVCLGLIF